MKYIKALSSLKKKHDNKTSKMWCFCICDLFRKILEEYLEIFSKNVSIQISL